MSGGVAMSTNPMRRGSSRARRGSARSDAPSVVDEATYKRFEDWAGAEAPTAAEFSRTSFSRKAAENGGPVMTGQIELGGAEGISTILQLLVADKDGDGVVSEEEKDSVAEKLTNDANNLLINSGVVAALTDAVYRVSHGHCCWSRGRRRTFLGTRPCQ